MKKNQPNLDLCNHTTSSSLQARNLLAHKSNKTNGNLITPIIFSCPVRSSLFLLKNEQALTSSYRKNQPMKNHTNHIFLTMLILPLTSMHAAQQQISIVIDPVQENNIEFTTAPLLQERRIAWTQPESNMASQLNMSQKRRRTICKSLKKTLPAVATSLVLTYADINEKEESAIQEDYAEFLLRLRALKKQLLTSIIITAGGATELALSYLYQGNLTLNTDAPLRGLAYAGLTVSSITFVYNYFRPGCTSMTGLKYWQWRNIVWNSTTNLVGSFTTFSASLAPLIPSRFSFIPLNVGGTIATLGQPIIAGRHCFEWRRLHQHYRDIFAKDRP